jgi:hypothetical protein
VKLITSVEFAATLAPAELGRLAAIFQFLSENACELRTANGLRLNDASDWRQFFREVAGVLGERERRSA